MKLKGAIFDLDGTLVDSMYIWDTIGEDYLRSRGIQPQPGLNDKFKSMSLMQAAAYYQSCYGLTDSLESLVDGVNRMVDRYYAEAVPLKPGVLPLLQALQAEGVKMCVATANDRCIVEASLLHNGIQDYFCGVLTCTQVGYGKDSPVIYEQALSLLCTAKEETLVFEDALYAIETAKGSGFQVAGVFDRSSLAQQEQIKALSDYYLQSFTDWSGWHDA